MRFHVVWNCCICWLRAALPGASESLLKTNAIKRATRSTQQDILGPQDEVSQDER